MSRLKSKPSAAAAKTEALQNKTPVAPQEDGIQTAAATGPLPSSG